MLKLHWKPKEWLELSTRERAVVLAGLELQAEAEQKEADKMKREAKKAKR